MFGLAAHADDGTRTQRVQFAKGANSATVEGTIKGYQTVDYVLHASQGQSMNVSMATRNTATYFNILAPGETEVADYRLEMIVSGPEHGSASQDALVPGTSYHA